MTDNGKITWTTVKVRVGDLIPWEENPRQMTKDQAERLERSFRKFGYSQLVEIEPDNTFVDGHQRDSLWKMVNDLGFHPDTTIEARQSNRKLSLDERKEYIALKHKGATGEWNWDAMLNLYDGEELLDFGFDEVELEFHGFEFDEEPPDDPGADIDKAEILREKWQVESGQLWKLGEHRLICGDCTDAEVVDRVMGGEKVDCLFTDPPYGIDYDPQFLPEIAERHNKKLSSTNKVTNDDGSLDLSFLFEYDRRMIWGFPYIYDSNATGWIVWDKQPGVEKRGIVTPIEMASTTMRKGFDMVRVMWGGMYRAAGEDRQPVSTQKPIGVYEPFIEAWTKPQEIIYDPFIGSAPVIIACERLNRKCRGVEIEPKYVGVTLERWSQMTGETPELVE